METNDDYSRDCEYTVCNYKCEGIDLEKLEKTKLEHSTSNIYYFNNEYKDIMKKIINLFSSSFYMSKDNILYSLNSYEPHIIIKVLFDLINSNKPILSPYFQEGFMRHYKNVFFLVPKITDVNDIFLTHYTKYPSLTMNLNPNEQLELIEESLTNNILHNFIKDGKTNLEELINKLNLSQQKLILKHILFNKLNNTNIYEQNTTIFNMYIKYFESSINEDDNHIILTFDPLPKKGEIEYLSKKSKSWTTCNIEDIQLPKTFSTIDEEIQRLENNPYKVYGIIEKSSDMFYIKEVIHETDVRKLARGRVCSTYEMKKLIIFLLDLKINVPTTFVIAKPEVLSKESLIANIHNDSKISKFYNVNDTKELEKLDVEYLCRLYNWSRTPKKLICNAIKEWFIDNNLMLIR